MKIGFITDTNILTKKQGNDISKLYEQEKFLDNMDFFINYINDLNAMKKTNELTYLMPDIILEELSQQKIEAYNKSYESLDNKYKVIEYGLKGLLPKNNIQEVINKERKLYLNKVTNIKLKYENKIYKELVKGALNKLPPFDKSEEKGKSDAGFKDALIWKTIVHSEEINNYDVIYYFSGDRIFEENEDYLIKEFEEKHPNTKMKIRFVEPNEEKLQNCLKIMIEENNFPETDCIKLYNKTYILEFVKSLKYNFNENMKLKNVVYDEQDIYLKNINFQNFNIEDFKIEDVERTDNKFVANIRFNTKKYEITPEEVVLEGKRNIDGVVKLKFSKNKKEFFLEHSEIIQVKFEETLQETLQRFSNNISDLFINNSAKLIIDNINNVIKPLQLAYENAIKNIVLPNYFLGSDSEENNPETDNDETDKEKQ